MLEKTSNMRYRKLLTQLRPFSRSHALNIGWYQVGTLSSTHRGSNVRHAGGTRSQVSVDQCAMLSRSIRNYFHSQRYAATTANEDTINVDRHPRKAERRPQRTLFNHFESNKSIACREKKENKLSTSNSSCLQADSNHSPPKCGDGHYYHRRGASCHSLRRLGCLLSRVVSKVGTQPALSARNRLSPMRHLPCAGQKKRRRDTCGGLRVDPNHHRSSQSR
ncbi:hypothetical protein C8R43DRAFT_1006384 [Mycena crocata]|nr:hypothetical protein C8R43DRAFT_1006384 [Mycena crocata]